MKNSLKHIVIVSLLVCASLTSKAATVATTIPMTGVGIYTNIINVPTKLLSIQVINGGNGAVNYSFIDGLATNAALVAQGYTLLAQSNGTYISYGQYVTNFTKINTNFGTGITFTNTVTGLWEYATTNAASTNAYRTLFSGVLGAGAGTTVTIPLGSGVGTVYGLTWTNGTLGTNIQVNIIHQPSL